MDSSIPLLVMSITTVADWSNNPLLDNTDTLGDTSDDCEGGEGDTKVLALVDGCPSVIPTVLDPLEIIEIVETSDKWLPELTIDGKSVRIVVFVWSAGIDAESPNDVASVMVIRFN